MSSVPKASNDEPIIIVGAGVFGLSTALELKSRGYRNVTILDRHPAPVPDGSSVDISRIIRTEYADPVYSQMASDALAGWRSEYRDFYHESGFVILAKPTTNNYVKKIKEVDASKKSLQIEYPDANDIKKIYPSVQAHLDGLEAYHNPSGGWADAEGSIRHLAGRCAAAEVKFITGPRGTAHALQMSSDGSRVTGVEVGEGSPLPASHVIVATGAWTNLLIRLTHAVSASGQPVGYIRLSPEEAERLRGSPVMINLTTGIFCFPPSGGEVPLLKIARHGYGYATAATGADGATVSSPSRDSNNVRNDFLPRDAEKALREGLAQLVPEFADHPWEMHRLCWYTDTPDGDFVIGHHPMMKGVFMATGGSGHAFKFLPVLGKYVVDIYERLASEAATEKWRLREASTDDPIVKIGDGSRAGPPLRTLTPQEQACI